MTDTSAPARNRWLAGIAIAALLFLITEPMLALGREPARWIWQNGPAGWAERPWIFVNLAILFQAVVGLAAILAMRRIVPRADAHLRWPPARSLSGLALAIGVGMGLIMLLADYWPDLASGTAPDDYPTAPLDAAGWLLAMAITGLAEETIFRGFMVGLLAAFLPQRVRIGRFDLPLAAFIVAAMFALAHWRSFVGAPFHLALAQQLYAFVWALIYVWLMERSRSLLAPMIAHGTGNAVEVGLVILWSALAGE
jgi:membrane protease YdiL (CAAX protease family)